MAEERIEKDGLLADDVQKSFDDLANSINKTTKELEEIVIMGGKLKSTFGDSKSMKGINEATRQLQVNLNKLLTEQKRLISTNKALQTSENKVQKELKETTTKLKEQEAQAKKNQRTRGKSVTGIQKLGSQLKRLIITYVGLTAVVRTFRSIFDTTKLLDSLEFATKNIIKDTVEYAETQAFLNKIIENYGLNLVDATRSYVKFRAAVGATNLTVSEGRQIFESFAKTGAVLGLRADEMNGVFLALEQMISKGKVTTEELRRQLGERIPGAFNIMANALGVTVSKLDDMLRKGEVLAEDALPKLAAEMERTFGIEAITRVDTLVASQERLRTLWREFVRELDASDDFINALNTINLAFVEMGKNFGFFLPSVKKGFEQASLSISNVIDNSKTADEALSGVRDRWRENNSFIKEQKLSITELEREYKGFWGTLKNLGKRALKGPFAYMDEKVARTRIVEAKKSLEKFQEMDRVYREALSKGLDELFKKRKKSEEDTTEETDTQWRERFIIFKAQQDIEFASFKEHQERMRAQQERILRDSNVNELEADRAIAGFKIDLEEQNSEFRQKQLDDRLNFTKGHAKEEINVAKELATEKVNIAKKTTDFIISEGKKEHNSYMADQQDKIAQIQNTKDEEISAIEKALHDKLGGLQLFATMQSKFAKIGGQQELIDSKLNIESLKATKSALEDMLDVANLTADEQASIEQQLFNTKKALQEAERAEYQKTFDERKQLQMAAFELGMQTISDAFNIFKGFQDARMQQIEWNYDREVALAGDNTDQKLAADNRYNEEKKKLQRRQAIVDKAQAAFNVIIDTIRGVMSATASVITLPLVPIIKAIGALNLAAVLATPVPSFEKGGKHEGGPARFSEGGKREIFVPDTGQLFITPGIETIANMPSGEFIPSGSVQEYLAHEAMNNFVNETSDIDLSTTNRYLRHMANKNQTNYSNGFKMTNKNNIFGRYVTRH
ncbi:MAG: tape measure protein [Candidatus Peribacteraceae bacterium]|nr:tape measure protein [Candidatus Peribacteraceae bacterium]